MQTEPISKITNEQKDKALGRSKLFIFIFVNLLKKIETIFAKNFARNYEKK